LIYVGDKKKKTIVDFNYKNIVISSSLTNVISILTLVILLFILIPKE